MAPSREAAYAAPPRPRPTAAADLVVVSSTAASFPTFLT